MAPCLRDELIIVIGIGLIGLSTDMTGIAAVVVLHFARGPVLDLFSVSATITLVHSTICLVGGLTVHHRLTPWVQYVSCPAVISVSPVYLRIIFSEDKCS